MTGHLEKLEFCPECGHGLTQAGYDAQACACGWGPFGVFHPCDRSPTRRHARVDMAGTMTCKWCGHRMGAHFRRPPLVITPELHAALLELCDPADVPPVGTVLR